jgi:hypothetical protein
VRMRLVGVRMAGVGVVVSGVWLIEYVCIYDTRVPQLRCTGK